MTPTANVTELVANLVTGSDVQSAWQGLSGCGFQGVEALLDAMEGKCGPMPRDRHPRDFHEDLEGGLQSIAEADPEPVIAALHRRPEHACSLIGALGSSRDEAAVQTLIEYAKHRDPWVRWSALSGLARYRRKSLRQVFLDGLRDRSSMVRFEALEALVKVADRRAIEPLRRYLARKDLEPGGRSIASELLAKLEKPR
jgi:hypothetical protein